jgi:2,4-dienoyl-CoA reductase-like NADH-dependent reductase (Old Yellow Enzyme family)
MKSIFDPLVLNNKTSAKNRLCRSATEEGVCVNGDINEKVYDIYTKLAEGGVGMVNSGMTEVSVSGLYVPGIAVAYHDDYEERLRPICTAMRRNNTVFNVQLVHSGFKSRGLPNPLLAPSPIETAPGVVTREITKDEIKGVVQDFAKAALKAKQAGAHGVQLHNAHGYLLSAFFSPYSNRRSDEYGGSRENRARLIHEIYDAVREAVGADFLVGIKTNCSDFKDPSITVEDCIWLINGLGAKGLDFAEISAGLIPGGEAPEKYIPMPQNKEEPIFYRVTAMIAGRVSVPVYAVAGWRSPAVMDRCLSESKIEGISMSRPFIREPALVNRWLQGDLSAAACRSCGACERHSAFAVYCREAPKEMKPAEWFGCYLDRK